MQVLLPAGWAPPIGYANGIAVDGGRLVFIAGQVGWDEQQRFHSDQIAPQFDQALRNVLAVLAEAGGQAERHLPHHRVLLRQAGLPGGAQRARRDLAPPHGQALSGDEHDLRVRPARQPGQDRARSDGGGAATVGGLGLALSVGLDRARCLPVRWRDVRDTRLNPVGARITTA